MNILINEGKFKECNVKIYGGKVMRSYAISEKGEIMGIRFIGNFAFSSRFFFFLLFLFSQENFIFRPSWIVFFI